jgi:hypothetical protein
LPALNLWCAMRYLTPCDSPISLDDLSTRIRQSSNFRFSWQFFQSIEFGFGTAVSILPALEAIIADSHLHSFLRDSFDSIYADAFAIEPLNEHCEIASADEDFENILASAAGDHLGAYSPQLRSATATERQEISDLFGAIGRYDAYLLLAGAVSGCPQCTYSSQLFSTWFYGVAWDWCLFAAWPDQNLLWMGCLTDTD